MNESEKTLIKRLKVTFSKSRFKYNARLGSFVRSTPFGFDKVSWGTYSAADRGRLYDVFDFGIGIRHDVVDNIVNRLGHIWGEENQRSTTTIYRNLSIFPFEEDRDHLQMVNLENIQSDVDRIADSIDEMMGGDGMRFFDQYASLVECSRGLNDPVEAVSSHPLKNNFPLRAYYGVAAAGVAEPERATGLVAAYGEAARTSGVADIIAYEVGKNLSGSDAVVARLQKTLEFSQAARNDME